MQIIDVFMNNKHHLMNKQTTIVHSRAHFGRVLNTAITACVNCLGSGQNRRHGILHP